MQEKWQDKKKRERKRSGEQGSSRKIEKWRQLVTSIDDVRHFFREFSRTDESSFFLFLFLSFFPSSTIQEKRKKKQKGESSFKHGVFFSSSYSALSRVCMRACMCSCACILEIIDEASYLFTKREGKSKKIKNNTSTDRGDDATSKTSSVDQFLSLTG